MTKHPSLRLVPPVGGAMIATRSPAPDADQDILVEATLQGGRLARFLAALDSGHVPQREKIGDLDFYVVPHSPFLDARITELVGTLIELRIAHPQLVQFGVVLEEAEDLVGSSSLPPEASPIEGPALSLAEGAVP